MQCKDKYFIALIPPSPVFEQAEAIKQELFEEHRLRGALRSPAHITLVMPFEWNRAKEDELIQQLRAFPFKRSFPVILKNYSCFSPRVLYIQVEKSEALGNLHYQLNGYVRRQLNIIEKDTALRGFHPHLTVAFRDLKKQLFYKLWEQFSAKQFYAEFECRSFSLLRLEKKWEKIADFPCL